MPDPPTPPAPDRAPIPKHALGDAVPDGPEFLARLRNPFLLARVDLQSSRLQLTLWPADYLDHCPPAKITRSLEALAQYYFRATHQRPRPWQAAPATSSDPPPPCVLLDNTAAAWTGILQPTAPRLWEVTDSTAAEGATDITWLRHFPGPPPSFPDDTRATAAFYRTYTTAENAL